MNQKNLFSVISAVLVLQGLAFYLMGDQSVRNVLSIHRPWTGEYRFLERVFKVEAFKKLYIARMEEFSGTIFEPGRIAKQVDEIAATNTVAVAVLVHVVRTLKVNREACPA